MTRRGTDPVRAAATPRPDSSSAEIPDAWIAIEDAARHLAIPTRTLYRLAQRQEVPAVKVGRTWRFKRSVLDAYLVRQVPSFERAPTRTAALPTGTAGSRRNRAPTPWLRSWPWRPSRSSSPG